MGEFDYQKILIAYLHTVLTNEGVTYAKKEDCSGLGARTIADLSPEEQAELGRLDDEVRASMVSDIIEEEGL